MEALRRALRVIANLYRAAFWMMVFTGVPSVVLVFSTLSKAHGGKVHWPGELKYLIPAALISWLVWRLLGRISARYFSYIIDYSDIRSFGGGNFTSRQVHRYTQLYRRNK